MLRFKGLKMKNENYYLLTDENGKKWFCVSWRNLEYKFDTPSEAARFYAELRYETMYGVLKPVMCYN